MNKKDQEKTLDPALVESGRMSHAIDRITRALQYGTPEEFGLACEDLLRAKRKYDQEIENRAMKS